MQNLGFEHAEAERCIDILEVRLPSLVAAADLEWIVVCGSGMGAGLLADSGAGGVGIEIEYELPLEELGLPSPTVAGHGGSLVVGRLGERKVCVQSGRLHPYEGHDAGLCTALLGALFRRCRSTAGCGLVLTCAVGGLDAGARIGELVSLRDHINLLGPTPLRGPAFVGMSEAYDLRLRARLARLSEEAFGEPLREVVYAHARGPQYETPAEVEALRRLGGDVVGMSTTYEAILAAAHGVPTCAVGTVTNVAGASNLCHEDVQDASAKASRRLNLILRSLLSASPPPPRRP